MMAERHLVLDRLLRALEGTDSLTAGALAQQLQLTERDVHVLMLTAQANRLVYKRAEAEWTITERGRRMLHQPDRSSLAPACRHRHERRAGGPQ
jgi:uncharacterized protein (DUF488 family)